MKIIYKKVFTSSLYFWDKGLLKASAFNFLIPNFLYVFKLVSREKIHLILVSTIITLQNINPTKDCATRFWKNGDGLFGEIQLHNLSTVLPSPNLR